MTETLYPPFGILLVDDEPAWLLSLSITLERCAGITNITTCEDSRDVMGILGARDVGIVLLDLTMPGPSGEELLARITEEHPGVIVIIISGMNQLETAVRCIQAGAFDYFVKTAEEDRIISGVLRAVRMLELQRENREMSKRLLSGTLSSEGFCRHRHRRSCDARHFLVHRGGRQKFRAAPDQRGKRRRQGVHRQGCP